MDSNFSEVIKIIAERLSGIRWSLYGSCNLRLQGMDVEAKSIGVVMSHENFVGVKDLFSDYQPIGPVDLENGEGQEYKFQIDGIDMVICGDYAHGFYLKKMRENSVLIKLDSIEISALSLAAEYECYKYLGKIEKANAIKKFINL